MSETELHDIQTVGPRCGGEHFTGQLTFEPLGMHDHFASSGAGPFGRRQRRSRGARLPVYVVTGFLGAGKTTLVKAFLQSEAGRNTAVVVNEFGDEGIDDALLRDSADETVLLGNGCLCCNVRSDLQVALRRLLMERDRGIVPHFERMVIETSGLADPSPILTTFATDRALGGEFQVEAVIAVADAVNGARALTDFVEARRQAMLADILAITKTDIVPSTDTARLRDDLAAFNPRARILQAGKPEVLATLFGEHDSVAGWRAEMVTGEAVHSDGVNSFTLTFDRQLDWPCVARSMDTLLSLRGSDLLRAKGLLDIEGCAGPVAVQFVQHLAHSPVELQHWPDGERRSRLVFIVRDIAEREVRALFDATAALVRH